MKKTAVVSISFLVLFGWILTSAHAATTTFLSSPPGSVQEGQLQADDTIFWFKEGTFTLMSPVHVDITTTGSYTEGSTLTGGNIATGTTVNSYFLHFDPTGQPSDGKIAIGTFSFPNPILGIIVLDASLDATDTLLGASGTIYPTGEKWRGLEVGPGVDVDSPDTIIYDADYWNVGAITEVIFAKGVGIDQVRAITAVPIPTSFFLLGCGLIGLVGLRRKIRN